MGKSNPKYSAKIKIVEQRWHGWSPEGASIPPKEKIIAIKSGAFLPVEDSERKMAMWAESDQEAATMKVVDYKQKEGFRLFISGDIPAKVSFTPEFRIKPIIGDEFPVMGFLPLVKKSLLVGETFEIKPDTRDSGVTYTITLLEINKQD